MNTLAKLVAAAVLVIGIDTVAVAQSHPSGHQSMDPAAMQKMMQEMTTSAPNDAQSTKNFKHAQLKMMMDMHIAYSGNADVDFVRGMIPHHQGAIEMAKVELKHGKNALMRKMAAKIIKDQEKEIAQMRAWLKKNEK